jgi:EAL domain-containing protein (putative c-di-GMP-specific phosphodiesterase class I)
LSSDVVAAFNEHRFVLGFQPVADAVTRATVFYEALLRMRRPSHPTSNAADFVVLAERLGLIRLIDQRCLELVADALLATSEARLSFNISAETVGDGQWLAQLSAAVAQRPALAKRLAVEITETAVMRNLDEAARFVGLLHDLGCEVALDDFGAGFSSFRSLRDLGVDLVKIDGSFVEKLVTNRDDQAFARALIDLAQNFGIKTVAEKVQDEESAQLLVSWGVNYLQGNLVGTASLDRPT